LPTHTMISTPASRARWITASRSESNSLPSMCAWESIYMGKSMIPQGPVSGGNTTGCNQMAKSH